MRLSQSTLDSGLAAGKRCTSASASMLTEALTRYPITHVPTIIPLFTTFLRFCTISPDLIALPSPVLIPAPQPPATPPQRLLTLPPHPHHRLPASVPRPSAPGSSRAISDRTRLLRRVHKQSTTSPFALGLDHPASSKTQPMLLPHSIVSLYSSINNIHPPHSCSIPSYFARFYSNKGTYIFTNHSSLFPPAVSFQSITNGSSTSTFHPF